MDTESSQMKLSNQRDAYRIRIRKEQINKRLQNLRQKYNPSVQAYLMNIDCPETMHNLEELTEMRLETEELSNGIDRLNYGDFLDRLQKCISDIWTYACSNRNDHIYGFFDQKIVDILIDRFYECILLKNTTLKPRISAMKSKILWILLNYTGTGGSIVSEHLVSTLMGILKSNENSHQTQLVLTFLGNLSDNPNYKNIMIDCGIMKQLTNNQYNPSDHIYALMKIMENIDYKLFCQYLDRTLEIATKTLYQTSDPTTVRNILQIYHSILTEDNLRANIRLLIGSHREISALHHWILEPSSRKISNQAYFSILEKAIEVITPIYSCSFENEDTEQMAINCIMQHFYEKAIKIVLMGLQFHQNQKVRQKSCYLLQNMCCQAYISETIMQNQRTLVSQIMQSLMSTYRQPEDRPIEQQPFTIKKSFILTLCNICLSTEQNQITILINKGIIEMFAHLLYDFQDASINMRILKSLKRIFSIGRYLQQENQTQINFYVRDFEDAGGIRKLQQTTEHNNEKIAKLADKILQRYCRLNSNDKLTQ